MTPLPLVILSVILGLMLAEARLASRNEAALRARGAIEPAGDVYRVMAILYPACFIAMGVEGYWRARSGLVGRPQDDGLLVSGVLLFVASKALKYWAIATLGDRWTFRVLVPPGSQRTLGGPYRVLRHPNYVGVAGEILGFALLDGASTCSSCPV